MSRMELMAAIALAAGMTLTVALIASPDSAEGEAASADFFDPSRFLGWLQPEEEPQEIGPAEDDLFDAY
ncbi:hypothetical protein [Rubellimicrobium roseum]|uniref:Uncharacterized protein n=1 Tax=Rubellimicrobium roseum TaxID=687525 RepID=A0A5C4NK37_9RHOB|nr:hypothetical protein [Rubellimicrobium roseum]TNC73476.1 hypothetical protein FHG71_06435 [Rubellimicrobium roseum]